MTSAQRAMEDAAERIKRYHLTPILDLVEAAKSMVIEAEARAVRAEVTLEALRPVWAQGYTSDSQAAQATANALSDLWEVLGAKNQTEAMSRLRSLI